MKKLPGRKQNKELNIKKKQEQDGSFKSSEAEQGRENRRGHCGSNSKQEESVRTPTGWMWSDSRWIEEVKTTEG